MTTKLEINLRTFLEQLQTEIEKGKIKPIKPIDLIVNMVSLCVFPIVASPVIAGVFQIDKNTLNQFLEERKKTVPEFIINAISIN